MPVAIKSLMFLDKYKGQTGLSKHNSYIFRFPNKFINHFEKEKAFLAFLFCGAEKIFSPSVLRLKTLDVSQMYTRCFQMYARCFWMYARCIHLEFLKNIWRENGGINEHHQLKGRKVYHVFITTQGVRNIKAFQISSENDIYVFFKIPRCFQMYTRCMLGVCRCILDVCQRFPEV